MSRPTGPRFNSYHSAKQQLLGNQAGNVAPAWRGYGVAGSSSKSRQVTNEGSKILLSRLPLDVPEKEVEELFKKTIGPVRESFLIHNSQGKSKGMAVVHFHNAEHAALAKSKYDGKYVDGRRPLKIEIVFQDAGPISAAAPKAPLTLAERLSAPTNGASSPLPGPAANSRPTAQPLPRQVAAAALIVAQRTGATPSAPKRRVKKGAKRVKKVQGPASLEQLDQEMEDYRASADASNVGS